MLPSRLFRVFLQYRLGNLIVTLVNAFQTTTMSPVWRATNDKKSFKGYGRIMFEKKR